MHARVFDKYIHFASMYMTDNIFPVLPIKHLVNKDCKLTTPHKMLIGKKTSLLNLRFLLCPCVVQKATAHVITEALNIYHQSQKGFCSIFIVIPQHQKRYLIYVLITRKIVSSLNFVFNE